MNTNEIADQLTIIAEHAPDESQLGPQEVFCQDGLTISCYPTRSAILAVAAKYRRGPVKRTKNNRKYYGTHTHGDRTPGPVTATLTTDRYVL
jgi:hypothetical protein